MLFASRWAVGASALAWMSLLAGCPEEGGNSSRDGATETRAKDAKDNKKSKKKDKADERAKSVELGELDAPSKAFFAGITGEETRGFGGEIQSISVGVPIVGGTLASEAFAELQGGADGGKVEAIFAGLGAKLDASSEAVQVEEGIIGSGEGMMIWRYVEPKPSDGGVQAHVGQIVILGGGAYETALVAISLDSKKPVAISPPIQLQAEGKVAKTKSAHQFVLPAGERLSNASGAVLLAMVASKGQGVNNGLPVAVAQVDSARVTQLKRVAEGYLSGRRFLSRGTTRDGAELATLMTYLAYDSRDECLHLEIIEVAAKGGEKEAHRISGCAKIAGETMRYGISMLCKAGAGGTEQCKRVQDASLSGKLEITADGLTFDGRPYQMLPIEDGVEPAPPAPKPQPQSEPEPPGPAPAPAPDDGTRKSYSDR